MNSRPWKQIRRSLFLGVLALLSTVLVHWVPAQATSEQDALPQIPVISQSAQSVERLLQEAQTLYEMGNIEDSVPLWQAAHQLAQQQNDVQKQAIALGNLSLSYQQLGQWSSAMETITDSLTLLGFDLDTHQLEQSPTAVTAHSLDILGNLYFKTSRLSEALTIWQQAEQLYLQTDQSALGQNLLNQVQVLQELGFYRQAQAQLDAHIEDYIFNQAPDLIPNALITQGNLARIVGLNLDNAEDFLQQGLEEACRQSNPQAIGDALMGLGDLNRSRYVYSLNVNELDSDFWEQSQAFYQQAQDSYLCAEGNTIVMNSQTQQQAQLRELSVLAAVGEYDSALAMSLAHDLAAQPNRRSSLNGRLQWAHSLLTVAESMWPEQPCAADSRIDLFSVEQLQTWLLSTHQLAQSLGDVRSQSRSLGYLGQLYQRVGQCDQAEAYTEAALQISEAHHLADLTYQWQAQSGRVKTLQGERTGAIAAYTLAVDTLQSLRRDLVLLNPDVQFSFRVDVEPIYRELVNLLLETNPSQSNLQQARTVIDALQTLEVENYLRQSCTDATLAQIDQIVDQISPNTAFIYPILLSDRLEVILKYANQPQLEHHRIQISKSEIAEEIDTFRGAVESRLYFPEEGQQASQQLYDWLIRPYVDQWQQEQITQLVFVLDGALRDLPVAALSDGEQFLAQKGYAIAVAPSLTLLLPQPFLSPDQMDVLAAGLTESRDIFGALPNVATELEAIANMLPHQTLLNQDFTRDQFRLSVQSLPTPIVHLATHGQFSPNLDETFLLAWDQRILLKDLSRILTDRDEQVPQSVELLVLSACETVSGNDQAALGLAGIAVNSGARSTLATLWLVNDRATSELIQRFYQELTQSPGITKAEALRRAQVSLIESDTYSLPYFWSPFVMVGNWQ